MHRLRISILLLSTGLIGGCTFLQASKLVAPEVFGLVAVSPRIYVESGADEAAGAMLRNAMQRSEQAIRTAYGSVNSRPVVHACITDGCYQAFGGNTSIAKVYGDRILLSPRGLNWHFIAHEWSHAELRSRLTWQAWWKMPQWFDEGVAVAISDAPNHSEAHWQFLAALESPRPTPEELHTFRSMRQWLAAVHRYGDDRNVERRAKGEPERSPVYAAAGHAVRPWLKTAGSQGLLDFIGALNRGAEFEAAYEQANPAFRRAAAAR